MDEVLLKEIKQLKNHSAGFMKNQPSKDRAVAYCSYNKHRGFLSKEMMKNHACLSKECPFLHKLDHSYWEQRSKKRANKKMRDAITSGNPEKIADIVVLYAFQAYEMEETL